MSTINIMPGSTTINLGEDKILLKPESIKVMIQKPDLTYKYVSVQELIQCYEDAIYKLTLNN